MTGKAGVWIDHRKAVIVALTPEGAQTTSITSKIEKHLERGGDSPLKGPYEAARVPADDSRQRAFTNKLNIYYGSVIDALRQFECLLLLGPGEAKGELHKRLVKMRLGGHVAAVETEDKMTDAEVVAKVSKHFGRDPPRVHQKSEPLF